MLAQTPSPIGTPADWSQFGLIGLVVFALFALLFSFGWFIVGRFGKMEDARNKAEDQRQSFLESCLAEHKQERRDMNQQMRQDAIDNRAALAVLTERTLKALDDNSDAFRAVQTEIHALLERHQG